MLLLIHFSYISSLCEGTVSTGLVRAVAQRKGIAITTPTSGMVTTATSSALSSKGSVRSSVDPIKRVATSIPQPHATNHVPVKVCKIS